MNIHQNKDLIMYFGDSTESFTGEFLTSSHLQGEQGLNFRLTSLKELLNLKKLFCLTQVHGNEGMTITASESFTQAPVGDFMVTKKQGFGLAVYTADCLPIVFYDPRHLAVGICHAGWAGSVKEVATKTLIMMTKEFSTDPGEVRIFFGPSAQVCCYEVQEEFLEHLDQFSFKGEVIQKRSGNLFFDLPLFNRLHLQEQGILQEAFTLHSTCTICDDSYCSNRRSQGSKERNLSIVALKG